MPRLKEKSIKQLDIIKLVEDENIYFEDINEFDNYIEYVEEITKD